MQPWSFAILVPITLSQAFTPDPQHSISSRATGKPQALTAPWMEDEPVPSSSSPSGSWSSLSVQEDTSSTELVRSGKLLDVNLRRSSAEVSCGNTKVHELHDGTSSSRSRSKKTSRVCYGWSHAPNLNTIGNIRSTLPGLQGYLKCQGCAPNFNTNHFPP